MRVLLSEASTLTAREHLSVLGPAFRPVETYFPGFRAERPVVGTAEDPTAHGSGTYGHVAGPRHIPDGEVLGG